MHSKAKIIVAIVAFVTVVHSHDVIVGQNTEGKKIFDENRQANPAIWRQTQNVTVNTTDTEIISRIVVTDLRPEKDGDVKVVDGGEGQKSVTLELKSPTVLRGYDFHIEVYAVPDKNQPKTEKDSTQVPSHPSQTRVQRNPDEDKNGQPNFEQPRTDLSDTKFAASTTDKNVPVPASVSTNFQGRQTRGVQNSELPQTKLDDKTKSSETSTYKNIRSPILIPDEDHSRLTRDTDENKVTTKIITNRPKINIPAAVGSTETTTTKQQVRNSRDTFEQPPPNISDSKNPSESSTKKNIPTSVLVSQDSKTRQRRDLDTIPTQRTNFDSTTTFPKTSINKNIRVPASISTNKPNDNSRSGRDTEKNEDSVAPNTQASTNNEPVKIDRNIATDKPNVVSPSSYRTEKYGTIYVSGKNLRIDEPTRNTRDTQNEDKIEEVNQRGKVAVNDNGSSFIPLNVGRNNENITNSRGSLERSRSVRDTQNESENDNHQTPLNIGKNLKNNTYTPVKIYERTARDTESDDNDDIHKTHIDHNKHPIFTSREFGNKFEKTNASSDSVRSVRDTLNEEKTPIEPVQNKNIENATNYPVTLNNDKIRKNRATQSTTEEYGSPRALIDNNGQRIHPPQITNQNVENVTNDSQLNRNSRNTQNDAPKVPPVLSVGEGRSSKEGQNRASVKNLSTTSRYSAATNVPLSRNVRDTQSEEPNAPRNLYEEQSKSSVNNPSPTPKNRASPNIPRYGRDTQNNEPNIPRGLPLEQTRTSINTLSTTPRNSASTKVPRHVRDTQNEEPNVPRVLSEEQSRSSVNNPSTTPRDGTSTDVPRNLRDTQNEEPNVPRVLPIGQSRSSISSPSITPTSRASSNIPRNARDTQNKEPYVPQVLPAGRGTSSVNSPLTTQKNSAAPNLPRSARDTQNEEPNVPPSLFKDQNRSSVNNPSTTPKNRASTNVPRDARDTQNEEQNVPRVLSEEQSRSSVNSPSTTPRDQASTDAPRNVRDTQNVEPNAPQILPENQNRASVKNPSKTSRNDASTNVPRNARDTENEPIAPQTLPAGQHRNIASTTSKSVVTDSSRHVRNAQEDGPELPPSLPGQVPENPEPRMPFSFQFQTYPFSVSFAPNTQSTSTTPTTSASTTTAKSRRRRDTSDLETSENDNKNGQWNPKILAAQNITKQNFDRKPVISIQ